jgi:hypothetical protein
MLLRLQCVSAHPLTPALTPGDQFVLSLTPSGSAIVLPITPRVLAHIVQAMQAGAIMEQSAPPSPEEVLAFVEARLLELAETAGDHPLPAVIALAG